MDIQEAIQAFQLLKGTNGITAAYLPLTDKIAFNELADAAILALQEQAERGTQRCKFCFEMKSFKIDGRSAKFCPMCGRRLK